MTTLEGRTLDRYELRQLIGRGGMADVYLGYDPRFDREVAVKVFKREDEDLLRRFIREARLMASLHNSHLMPVYDTGEGVVDGVRRYYIVMPFIDGGTLRARIRRGPLPLSECCRILNDIADALDYIHEKGIIHRDIKSSNVLLSSDGRCYLSDFGIARNTTDATQLTSTGNVLGTVDYVAPELFENDHRADVRSDLYSLGILLYEMVTGRMPFVGENQLAVVTMHINKRPPFPRRFVPDLPVQVERVMLKVLEKNPSLRYGSASELAGAFCQATTATPVVDKQGQATAVWSPDEPVYVREGQQAPLVLPPVDNPVPVRQAPLTGSTTGYHYNGSPQWSPPAQPMQTSGRSRRQSYERQRARIVSIIAVLILLLIVGPSIYVIAEHPFSGTTKTNGNAGQTQTATAESNTATVTETATPNATATARAIANATATASANATATAIAGVTATAVAQARATAGVIQTATAGKTSYSSALTQNDGATWDQNTRNCIFKNDGYHVLTGGLLGRDNVFKGCREQNQQFSDFALSVNMNITSGQAGGVFFRLSAPVLNIYMGYLFQVDSQGNYTVFSSQNYSDATASTKIKSGTIATGWKKGTGVSNTLQIIAQGPNISLYVNGVYIDSVQDGTFQSGEVGFVATKANTNDPQAEVVYSNLKVYPLS